MGRITLIDEGLGLDQEWKTDPALDLDPTITIHAVGDLHFGDELESRQDVAYVALEAMNGSYAKRVFCGDLTDNGYRGQWEDALAWIEGCSPEDWLAIPGNHDYNDGNPYTPGVDPQPSGYTWTDWEERSEGRPHRWVEDVGDYIRLIGLGALDIRHELWPYYGYITEDMMNWVATQADTDRRCLLFFHVPLKDSVIEAGKVSGMYICHPHDDIIAWLDDLPSIKAWVSAHTHSSLQAQNLVMPYQLPSRTMAHINVSAVHSSPVKPPQDYQNNISCFITVGEDRIDVRYLDHKKGTWAEYAGNTVTTIAV